MKKDDLEIKITLAPKEKIRLSDNIITDADLAKHQHQPTLISRNIENPDESKREQSWVNLFFREGFALLKFKPYSNYHIAIRAAEAYCGFNRHDLKLSSDYDNSANELICCSFLLKFLNTITNFGEQEKQFKQSYKFAFENKLLWSETKWKFSYDSSKYEYTICSGAQNVGMLHSQLYHLLNDIRFNFPRLRAEDLFFRVLRIAESTNLDDGL